MTLISPDRPARCCTRLLILASFSALGARAFAADDQGVLLVDEGKPKAVIVWDQEAAKDVHNASLQRYVEDHLPWAVEQITGARPSVATTQPADDQPAIMIGKRFLSPDAQERLKNSGKRFDTRMLCGAKTRIYLAGATARGDAGAIADFIHDDLGLRMYGPDPVQWNVPRTKTLRVSVQERIWTPVWIFRSPWYDGHQISKDSEQAKNYGRFTALMGGGPGMSASAGHAWHYVLPPKEFEAHPEYFAEVKGKRQPTQACTSNPQVIDIFVNHYLKHFASNAASEVASISPNDGAGYCTCAKCRAVHPDLSTRLLMFFNEVGRRVAEKYPDRYLAFYAYAYNDRPPKTEGLRVQKNVIAVLAHYGMDTWRTPADAAFNSSNWDFVHKKLIPWRKISDAPYFFAREYMNWWYGPWPMYRSMLAATRVYADYGVNGVSREYQGRDFGTDLHMYLELRMTTDPYQDGGKLLDRVFSEYYGPAADTARRVSFELEDALRRATLSVPYGLIRKCPETITAEMLSSYAESLSQAKTNCTEIITQRLDRDVRYLRCAALYADFFKSYGEASTAARKNQLTTAQCNRALELMDRWLKDRESLVKDELKGHSWLHSCITRDADRVRAFLRLHCPKDK